MSFNANSRLSERQAVVKFATPATAVTTTTVTLGPIDLGLFGRGQFIVNYGTVTGTGTITATVMQSVTVSSTLKALSPAKASNVIVAAAAPGVLEVDIAGFELDLANNYQFASLVLVSTAATSTLGGEAIAGDARVINMPDAVPATVTIVP